MTNRVALILGILIVAAFFIDLALYGSEDFIFLGKRLYEFIDWIAFWR